MATKIVISGKSSEEKNKIISQVKSKLESKGHEVVVSHGTGDIKNQIALENTCNNVTKDNAIILYNNGIMDATLNVTNEEKLKEKILIRKKHLNAKTFWKDASDELLKENKLTKNDVLKRYDAVFLLGTEKEKQLWSGHNHLRVIENEEFPKLEDTYDFIESIETNERSYKGNYLAASDIPKKSIREHIDSFAIYPGNFIKELPTMIGYCKGNDGEYLFQKTKEVLKKCNMNTLKKAIQDISELDATRYVDEAMKCLTDKIKENADKICEETESFLSPVEIEKKFLIEYPDTTKLEKNPNCEKIDIKQTYLIPDNEKEEKRVRLRSINGDNSYFLTIKSGSGEIREEKERQITKEEYDSLLKDALPNGNTIEKTRYCLESKGQYFEIDIYPFWKNQAVMEIELNNAGQEIKFPQEINIILDITDNKIYKNGSLAKHIPEEFTEHQIRSLKDKKIASLGDKQIESLIGAKKDINKKTYDNNEHEKAEEGIER